METALQQIWKDTNQGKGIGVKKLKQLLQKAGIKLTQEEFESQEKAIVQSWEKLKRQKTGVHENNKAETNGDVSVLVEHSTLSDSESSDGKSTIHKKYFWIRLYQ